MDMLQYFVTYVRFQLSATLWVMYVLVLVTCQPVFLWGTLKNSFNVLRSACHIRENPAMKYEYYPIQQVKKLTDLNLNVMKVSA